MFAKQILNMFLRRYISSAKFFIVRGSPDDPSVSVHVSYGFDELLIPPVKILYNDSPFSIEIQGSVNRSLKFQIVFKMLHIHGNPLLSLFCHDHLLLIELINCEFADPVKREKEKNPYKDKCCY
jgi:hypothetical protein